MQGWWEIRLSSESMTSLPATDIYNLKWTDSLSAALLQSVHSKFTLSFSHVLPVSSLTFGQLIGQPVQALVQTRALSGTGTLGVHLWANRKTGDTRTRKHNQVLKVWFAHAAQVPTGCGRGHRCYVKKYSCNTLNVLRGEHLQNQCGWHASSVRVCSPFDCAGCSGPACPSAQRLPWRWGDPAC